MRWHPHRIAGTLAILQDGRRLTLCPVMWEESAEKVPQGSLSDDGDRTSFVAPAGFRPTRWSSRINIERRYGSTGRDRDSTQVAGMYAAHEFNVSQWIKPGQPIAAVKVTPDA